VHCAELGGICEWNLTSIWIWCQGCCSFSNGAFWSIKPYCHYLMWLAFEYDVKVVVPFLMVRFVQLNLIATTWCCKTRTWENMFSVQASIEKSSWAWITRKLYLFTRFFISSFSCVDQLTWRQMHED
jgi:hypothetical protein